VRVVPSAVSQLLESDMTQMDLKVKKTTPTSDFDRTSQAH
jgi:hypothetical protein